VWEGIVCVWDYEVLAITPPEEKVLLMVCSNAPCPSYGLFQVPAEDMPKEVNDNERRKP